MRYVFLTLICLGIVVATNFDKLKGYFQAAAPKPETVFQVGDCYFLDFQTTHEAWETSSPFIHKIIQIGESSYWSALRVMVDNKWYWVIGYDSGSSDSLETVKKYGIKVTCPETTDNKVYVIRGKNG